VLAEGDSARVYWERMPKTPLPGEGFRFLSSQVAQPFAQPHVGAGGMGRAVGADEEALGAVASGSGADEPAAGGGKGGKALVSPEAAGAVVGGGKGGSVDFESTAACASAIDGALVSPATSPSETAATRARRPVTRGRTTPRSDEPSFFMRRPTEHATAEFIARGSFLRGDELTRSLDGGTERLPDADGDPHVKYTRTRVVA
jgi:hypothetical protein